MEELGYFTANEPDAVSFKRRGGRLMSAAVLMTLLGLAVALFAAFFALITFRFRYELLNDRHYLYNACLALLILLCTAGYMLITAAGIFRKRRWSLPFARLAMLVWLAFGMPLAVIYLVDDLVRRDRSEFWPTSWELWLENLVIPYVLLATFLVGLPGLIYLLLRPDDVRRTLELHDITPRWTDGRSLSLGVAAALFGLIAFVLYWHQSVNRHFRFRTARIADYLELGVAFLLMSSFVVLLTANRRAGRILTFSLVGFSITAMTYLGLPRNGFSWYYNLDQTVFWCEVITVTAIGTTMLIRDSKESSSSELGALTSIAHAAT